MGRGKIEIKFIENPFNRQITYSKRKSGILKKARELTILCNAQVCLIMFSKSGKIAEYISPSTTLKDFLDRYQRKTNTDLWEAQYEALQKELRAQQEIGSRLKKEIRQRTGGDGLSELSFEELRVLEEDLHHSLGIVRNRKNHVLTSQTRTTMKSIRIEETRRSILQRSLCAEREKQESHLIAVPAGNDGDDQPHFTTLQMFTNWFSTATKPSQSS
ncbi:MADS-box transcription factor 16-like [Papaver somniferum]|uniref:MADS-box transcription factor 16-like n=1 Tax=Papaver somniferum TaxID=3469 RepID=UPI000E701BB0|nr:MADS-box transcription factor 16-like [Papaver somniferum]